MSIDLKNQTKNQSQLLLKDMTGRGKGEGKMGEKVETMFCSGFTFRSQIFVDDTTDMCGGEG